MPVASLTHYSSRLTSLSIAWTFDFWIDCLRCILSLCTTSFNICAVSPVCLIGTGLCIPGYHLWQEVLMHTLRQAAIERRLIFLSKRGIRILPQHISWSALLGQLMRAFVQQHWRWRTVAWPNPGSALVVDWGPSWLPNKPEHFGREGWNLKLHLGLEVVLVDSILLQSWIYYSEISISQMVSRYHTLTGWCPKF